jgi:DNA (cytosine-5)-methyltransferase 1
VVSQYKTLSLFSGACGLDLGLESTGRFSLLACLEFSPTASETIRWNRDQGLIGTKRTRVFQGDISSFDPAWILDELGLRPGELDVLVGGPPCQTFSTAGRRKTVQDPRGSLIWQFLRYVEVIRPRVFLMENVRGLLSAALRHRAIAQRPNKGGPPLEADEMPGSVVQLWVDDLIRQTDGEYRVDCFEVNAVNYGAPQLRERALFIGNRLGHVVDFPEPTHAAPETLDNEATGGMKPFATLASALDGIVEQSPILLDFSPRKKRFLSFVPPGGNWRSLPVELQKESMGRAWDAKGGRSGWWRRLSRDLPCPTIVTMPNHASTSMCHPDEVRALSLAECSSVQGFPRDWRFMGTPQEQYQQVGNAVPVRLGEVAGDSIAAHLDAGAAVARPVGDEPFRRVYVKSHVRTRQWYKGGEVFVWSSDGDNDRTRYNARQRSSKALSEDCLPEVDVDARKVERLAK